jgi:hypothetical protein
MSNNLTTLANVKSWIGINAATDDALIERLIGGISQYIQSWLNRQFASQVYSEIRDGNGGRTMMFADYPVTSVSSVKINGKEIPPTNDFVSPGYRFSSMAITLNGYVFEKGVQNIELVYTAGYEVIPQDIEQATIELVALRYKERDRIGQQSKNMANGETVTYMVKDFPPDVATLLKNYKKVIPL